MEWLGAAVRTRLFRTEPCHWLRTQGNDADKTVEEENWPALAEDAPGTCSEESCEESTGGAGTVPSLSPTPACPLPVSPEADSASRRGFALAFEDMPRAEALLLVCRQAGTRVSPGEESCTWGVGGGCLPGDGSGTQECAPCLREQRGCSTDTSKGSEPSAEEMRGDRSMMEQEKQKERGNRLSTRQLVGPQFPSVGPQVSRRRREVSEK